MNIMIISGAAILLSFQGSMVEQQTGTVEETEGQEGIPSTQHQEEAVREIESDHFNHLDQDGDGLVTRQEAQGEAELTDNWSEFDQDGDGSLDTSEFAAFEQRDDRDPAAQDARALPRGDTEAGMPATEHQEEAVGDDLVGELDRDGDGRISQEEAREDATLSDNWRKLDKNGDGMLDASELDDQGR